MNILRILSIVLGFSFVFKYLLNIEYELVKLKIIPISYLGIPSSEITSYQYFATVFTCNWILPIILSSIFVFNANIHKRYTTNYGTKLISIAVSISIIFSLIPFFVMFYIHSYIGAIYLTYFAGFINYLGLPLRIMMIVGVVKLFLSLKPAQEA